MVHCARGHQTTQHCTALSCSFSRPIFEKIEIFRRLFKDTGVVLTALQFALAILEDMRIDVCKLVPSQPEIETVVLDKTTDTSENESLTWFQKNVQSKFKKREELIRKFSSDSSESDNSNAESKLLSELTSYQAEIIDLHQFEIMPWWYSKQQSYPMLAGLFRSVHHVFRLLVQTLNEYGLFSGLIISSRRSRIGNNNFKQHQLYVHENWNMYDKIMHGVER